MKKFLLVFLGLFFLILPLVVSAQGPVDAIFTICSILNVVKVAVLAIGLGIAVIVIIIGGIQYATAGSSMDKAQNARRLILNGIIGIAIVFAAAFILAIIQGLLVGGGVPILVNPCNFL